MPESDFVYEKGDAIDVGTHGDHDYVFAKGDPVQDTGESAVVFESGTGIGGGGSITFRWYAADGTELASLGPIEDQEFRSGGVRLVINHSGTTGQFTGWLDYIYITSSNTLIDSMEDGGMGEYTTQSGSGGAGGQSSESVTTNQSYDGSYAWEVTTSNGAAASARSTSGLPAYPSSGDTFGVRARWTDGTMADMGLGFGVQDANNYYSTRVDSHQGEDGNTTIDITKTSGGSGSSLASTGAPEMENYQNEWTYMEVEWE